MDDRIQGIVVSTEDYRVMNEAYKTMMKINDIIYFEPDFTNLDEKYKNIIVRKVLEYLEE